MKPEPLYRGLFRQIELNYDLHSIDQDKFWDMLTAEFGKFKKAD